MLILLAHLLTHLRFFAAFLVGGLLLSALACLELGRRLGRRRVAQQGEGALEGFGAVESAVFALLGLLIAFTFAAAASRYDARRDLIVQEGNAIGTAYLRLDLLPPASQPELRRMFGQYLDARLEVYRQIAERRRPREEMARVASLQEQIWRAAVAGCQQSSVPQAMILVLPALNEMIDITTTRTLALRTHLPGVIVALLLFLMMACSLLAGHAMARSENRSWAHMLAFAAILTVSVFVILDYEFPRFGFIRIDWADQLLVALRKQMP